MLLKKLSSKSLYSVTSLFAALLTSPVEAVTFEQAWQQTLATSESLAADKANVARTEALQDAATDLYWPKVELTGRYTHMQKPVSLDLKDLEPVASLDPASLSTEMQALLTPLLSLNTVTDFTSRNVASGAIQAIWPLYTGGRRGAAVDIAKEQHIEAGQVLAMKQQAQFEDLARVYFAVVLTAQVVNTYQEVEEGLRLHQQNAVKLEQQGQIAAVERLQADASYDKAKVDTLKATRQYEIAQLALTTYLHQSQTAEPVTRLFVVPTIPPLSYYLDQTLASYPGLAILDSKQEQASQMVSAARGGYIPEVYLYGSYQLYEDDSLLSETTPDWMVGIGVSLPLLDNSGRSGKLQAAHSLVDQVTFMKAQAERDLRLLVEKTYREALQAQEEFEGLDSSLKLAAENLRLRQKAFNQGLATSMEVVDAELYQASVKTQQQKAAYHFVVALAQLTALSSDIDHFSDFYKFN